jgi:steroid 5-alpha reductase family enzyme
VQPIIFNLFFSLLVLIVYQHAWCAIALLRKRNDLADIAWGLGFPVLGWANWLLSPSRSLRATIVVSLVTLWGVRLALHLATRAWGRPEDARYKEMRKGWGGKEVLNTYLKIFMLQGAFLLIVALPVIEVSGLDNTSIGFTDYLGIIVFCVGFMIETVSDRQLFLFVKTKKPGQVMQTGLWRYSRHPNYFGEILLWWGLAISVCFAGAWTAVIGPLVITFLILKVSGIPMLEKRYEGNPAFEDYKKRTQKFFPWFPKKVRST